MAIDKSSLRTVLIQSIITGKYMPLDDTLSARICGEDGNVEAKLIDHNSLTLMAKVNKSGVSLDHDLLTEIVDELAHEVDIDEDFNIMGIYTYEDLLRHLQNGLQFGEISTYRDGTKNLSIVLRADEHYIYWHNYGSSAHCATVKDMEFVIERIFGMELSRFIREYIWV